MDDKNFDEYMIDARLHIRSIGRIDSYSDDHIYPYEPTSYSVLERLAESGLITERDHLLDYGCGKARILIYMHYKTGCRASGVEMMRDFYDVGKANVESYDKTICRPRGKSCGIELICGAAQTYELPPTVNRIFFFNPFSVEVFESVMKRVMDSFYENSRRILLFLYYPQDEYITYLSRLDEVMFEDEIDCMDLFQGRDKRNRIMIYEIGGE
ncbi:MAG: SAM-dependent methyltransferase [Lachnospiraceae bacterium]|nr:SAM-dependent methyltransferase [Lachnospiraceae bacterium]